MARAHAKRQSRRQAESAIESAAGPMGGAPATVAASVPVDDYAARRLTIPVRKRALCDWEANYDGCRAKYESVTVYAAALHHAADASPAE